jgi:hypothetical protein
VFRALLLEEQHDKLPNKWQHFMKIRVGVGLHSLAFHGGGIRFINQRSTHLGILPCPQIALVVLEKQHKVVVINPIVQNLTYPWFLNLLQDLSLGAKNSDHLQSL